MENGTAASGCDFGQGVSRTLFAPRQSRKTVSPPQFTSGSDDIPA
jgi:hypothetical protein